MPKVKIVRNYSEINNQCPKCDFTCTTASKLKRHSVKHSNVRSFQCSLCNHRSKTKDNLRDHERTHSSSKPFPCQICGYSFRRQASLNEHLIQHTEKQKREQYLKPCTFEGCTYKTIHQSSLRNHLKKTHSDERPYKCTDCKYACKYTKSLKQHMIQHMDSKNKESLWKECPHENCNYKTVYSCTLKRHLRIHSNEKPFQCTVCEMSFQQKRYLKQHGEFCKGKKKEYKSCLMLNCNYRTASLRMFKSHLKKHGKKFKEEYFSEGIDDDSQDTIPIDMKSAMSPVAPKINTEVSTSPSTMSCPSKSRESSISQMVHLTTEESRATSISTLISMKIPMSPKNPSHSLESTEGPEIPISPIKSPVAMDPPLSHMELLTPESRVSPVKPILTMEPPVSCMKSPINVKPLVSPINPPLTMEPSVSTVKPFLTMEPPISSVKDSLTMEPLNYPMDPSGITEIPISPQQISQPLRATSETRIYSMESKTMDIPRPPMQFSPPILTHSEAHLKNLSAICSLPNEANFEGKKPLDFDVGNETPEVTTMSAEDIDVAIIIEVRSQKETPLDISFSGILTEENLIDCNIFEPMDLSLGMTSEETIVRSPVSYSQSQKECVEIIHSGGEPLDMSLKSTTTTEANIMASINNQFDTENYETESKEVSSTTDAEDSLEDPLDDITITRSEARVSSHENLIPVELNKEIFNDQVTRLFEEECVKELKLKKSEPDLGITDRVNDQLPRQSTFH